MNRKIFALSMGAAAALILAGCGEVSSSAAASQASSNGSVPASSSVASSVPASSVVVSSSVEPVGPTAITAAELVEWNAAQNVSAVTIDGDTIWTTSGILEGWAGPDGSDSYGDCYITVGEISLLVYGSTTTTTCITGDAGSYAFVNPKDAKTTLADYHNGERVTMTFIRECYMGKLELLGFFTAHVADTSKYTASVDAAIVNGSVVLDKSSDLAYGETVTATVTPAAGFKVGAVTVLNRQNLSVVAVVDPVDATKYTFKAMSKNVVTAAFVSAAELSVTLNATNLGMGAYAADSVVKTIDGYDFSYKGCGSYGAGIQMRIDSKGVTGTSEIHNVTAFDHVIKSVTLAFNASKTRSASDIICVSAGTAMIGTPADSDVISHGSIVDNSVTISYTEASAFAFVNVGHHSVTTGSEYIDSIKVVFYE